MTEIYLWKALFRPTTQTKKSLANKRLELAMTAYLLASSFGALKADSTLRRKSKGNE
jgi:heme/copper-type cytochrome/quinol oxidase subunit 3